MGKGYKKEVVWEVIDVRWKGVMDIGRFVDKEKIKGRGERFKKGGMVIGNDECLMEIVVLLGVSGKVVMVRNEWVWECGLLGGIMGYGDLY